MQIRRASALLGLVGAVLATLGTVSGAWAAGNTIRIDPPTQTVASGGTFTVRVIQNASVPTGGVSATVTFDTTKAQIVSIAWGAPWAGAPILIPADFTKAIASANTTGVLKNAAAANQQPTTVPTGDAVVFAITFKAVGCGALSVGLPVGPVDAGMLDGRDSTWGNPLKVTTTGGSVTLCSAGASAGPSPSAAGAASPSAPGAASPTPAAASTAPGSSVAPSASTAPADASTAPASSAAPSAPAADSTTPGASVAPSLDATGVVSAATGTPGSDSGQPPWLLIGLVVVVAALAAGGLLLQRSRRT